MVNAAHLEAVMLRPFETEVELEAIASNVEVAIIGPAAGVSEATLSNVLALARTGAALVVDADALSVFRDEPEELFSALDRDDVLTPHPGEFERIFPGRAEGLARADHRRAHRRRSRPGRGAAQGIGHGDLRARRPRPRSTSTARPGWRRPGRAMCWPASSAA